MLICFEAIMFYALPYLYVELQPVTLSNAGCARRAESSFQKKGVVQSVSRASRSTAASSQAANPKFFFLCLWLVGEQTSHL